jgi:hypothetical protein
MDHGGKAESATQLARKPTLPINDLSVYDITDGLADDPKDQSPH